MSFSCSTQQSCSTKSFNHTVLILTASGFEVQFSTWLLQESQWQSHDPAQLQLPALVAALVVKPDSQAPGCLGASQYISIWMSASANQWQISHFFPLFSRGSRYLSHATSIRDTTTLAGPLPPPTFCCCSFLAAPPLAAASD